MDKILTESIEIELAQAVVELLKQIAKDNDVHFIFKDVDINYDEQTHELKITGMNKND